MRGLWQRRTFWDGKEAVFVQNNGSMSCFDLDSDELGSIIAREVDRCSSQIEQWQELQSIREEFINGKKSN